MLMVVSPAKKMDFSNSYEFGGEPVFASDSLRLIEVLRGLSVGELEDLMGISRSLAELNFSRYCDYGLSGGDGVCAICFRGDVYQHLGAINFSSEDWSFADEHLRILSGLYGVLRPSDRIFAHRLEMGTGLRVGVGVENLYDFWGDRIAKNLASIGSSVLVNLASVEYFRSVMVSGLGGLRVLNVHFREERDGVVRTIALLAKRARGMMARFAILGRIRNVEELKNFREAGYCFCDNLSDSDNWVFVRASY